MLFHKSAGKLKYYIVRFNLCPVERKVACQVWNNSRCQICKSINITDKFNRFTTKINLQNIVLIQSGLTTR